jgi:hypothetical protein
MVTEPVERSTDAFLESLNAFGKRIAWEFPDLNTLAVAPGRKVLLPIGDWTQ